MLECAAAYDSAQLLRVRRFAQRKRANRACRSCKRNKIKCNDFRPCLSCKTAGIDCNFQITAVPQGRQKTSERIFHSERSDKQKNYIPFHGVCIDKVDSFCVRDPFPNLLWPSLNHPTFAQVVQGSVLGYFSVASHKGSRDVNIDSIFPQAISPSHTSWSSRFPSQAIETEAFWMWEAPDGPGKVQPDPFGADWLN